MKFFERGLDVQTVTVLEKAKELISKPEFWVKGSNATDSDGVSTAILDPYACRFCMNGALLRVTGFASPTKDYDDARRTLYEVIPGNDQMHRFNDKPETTHADVMEIFDKAIALARTAQTMMDNRAAN
jgi:hypothetical protein